MGFSSNLVILSLVATSVLGLPRPDEYKIPEVGNGRRSQYYVLHDDGSHKYGYDTGEDAFESLKTNSDGEVDGKFGYRDPEGQEFRVQYTSGSGGFVAQGDHIPQVHPDVAAAFAAARAAGPFVDPLADADGDRSFDFEFDGEEYSRNEVSDSDGTVTGSYSYVDEFGRTRTYTYRAGKGIGFVIEGDDIPQPVQPLPSHSAIAATHGSSAHSGSSVKFGAARGSSVRSGAAHGSSAHSGSSVKFGAARESSVRTGAAHGSSAHSGSSVKFGAARGSSVRGGAAHGAASSGASFSASSHNQGSSSHRTKFQAPNQSYISPSIRSGASSATSHSSTRQHTSQRTSPTTTFTSANSGQFQAANTRTSFSPRGSYSLAYETSSHSRQEAGDDDNNVRGQFSFTADDDGEERTLTYEANSATGFTVQGAHLPFGAPVPGASTGQVTGRIEPVEQIEFIDPLADDDTDASYNFGFDSDSYSRSETTDEDGNVQGTYSVLGEDNILRTYRYRAGEGIGFETSEISAVPSRSRASSTTRQQSTSFRHGGAAASGVSSSSSASKFGTGAAAGTSSSSASRFGASGAAFRTPSPSAHASRASAQSTFSANTRNVGARTGFSSTHQGSDEVFPGFTLHKYDQEDGRGKFGYVLKFD